VSADAKRLLLTIVLCATAAFLALVLPFMFDWWPGGFRWGHPGGHPAYERMIVAIYFSLGVCLVPAALNPQQNVLLIDFTILSSVLHGTVMTYDSFAQPHEMTHLIGDVPLLFVLAGVLAWLHPRWWRTGASASGAPAEHVS